MSLLIGENSVVTVNYTLTDDAGKVLDSSDGSKPMVYLHGAGSIVPGLEKALVGKGSGESCLSWKSRISRLPESVSHHHSDRKVFVDTICHLSFKVCKSRDLKFADLILNF